MNQKKPQTPSTREQLLEAGRRLFAARGYEGTSVRDLTAAAGANLGAVTYHFGSKQALYEAVIASFIDPMREQVEAAATSPGSPLDRVELVVRTMYAHFNRHPEQPAIMLHEMARQQELPAPVRDWLHDGMTRLMALISQGQEDGLIVEGHPLPMAMNIVSQPFFFAITKRPWARTRGLKPLRITGRDAAEAAARLIRRSLEAPRRQP